MPSGASNHLAARRRLSRADPRMASIIRQVGPAALKITPSPFHTLVGSIIHQQISMSAAASVRRRLVDLCGRLTPASILAHSEAELRNVGVSRQKAAYLRDIAEHFADGRITPAKLRRRSDDEVIELVTQIKGVGRWTAEMLLMFCLAREDVWPIDDLGLRKGLSRYMGLADLPDKETAAEAGERFRPHRTLATWYLWRSLESPISPGVSP